MEYRGRLTLKEQIYYPTFQTLRRNIIKNKNTYRYGYTTIIIITFTVLNLKM